MSLFHKLGLIVSIYTELFVLTAMCLLGKKSVSWYHQHLSRLLHVTHSTESLVYIFNLMSVWQKLLRQAVTLCPPTGLGCPGEHWAADTALEDQPNPSLQPAWNKLSFAVGTEKFPSMYYFSQKTTLFTRFFLLPAVTNLQKEANFASRWWWWELCSSEEIRIGPKVVCLLMQHVY